MEITPPQEYQNQLKLELGDIENKLKDLKKDLANPNPEPDYDLMFDEQIKEEINICEQRRLEIERELKAMSSNIPNV